MSQPEITAVHLRALAGACSPVAAYQRLRGEGLPWLLESALRRPGVGRFSFVGADPYAVLRAFGRSTRLEVRRDVRPVGLRAGRLDAPPLEVLRACLPPAPSRVQGDGTARRLLDALPFAGGAVGYLGYELDTGLEHLALRARDELGLPDLALLLVDRLAVFDHETRRSWALGLGFDTDAARAGARAARAAARLARMLRALPPDSEPGEGRTPAATATRSLEARARSAVDAAGYAKGVAAVKEQIAAGNVYQANFTRRLELPFAGDPFALYRVLRRGNPAPFAACLELPEVGIVASSPERFLRVDARGRVESRPIKGTRPRERDARRDAAQAEALARSAKDRAENLMILDLVRNDLGRVCAIGSIRVPERMAIERHASVWQMVSVVEGRLAAGRDALDLVAASFPPGSMTGAPKIAAMRLIDRLEPVRRSVYAGALGYFDLRGGLDLCVVIRTWLVRTGRAFAHSGGAVVADSEPEAEYRESLDKARALLVALERASG